MKRLWQKTGAAGIMLGSAAFIPVCLSGAERGADTYFNASLLMVFLGWAGALAGGAFDYLRHGRSPFEPLFERRFAWFYRQGYWLRFAFLFALGWSAFVLIAVLTALAVGKTEEARIFFSLKGASVLAVFLAVFAAEGALIGGLLDLIRRLMGRK